MGKRKISLILFLETLIIGVISLGIGLVYITRNPSINATNTLTPESVVLISFTISLVSSDILSIVVCVSIALKR